MVEIRRIIDVHAHIYPANIAEKACVTLENFYDNIFVMQQNGTIENLLLECDKAKVEKVCVCSVATTPHQVPKINDWIASQVSEHKDKVIGFGAIQQDYPEFEKEVERIIDLGLKGIKIHPDYQQINADDMRLMRLYELCEGRLIILCHAGDIRYGYSNPKRIRNIIDTFPKLKLIAAHMGGYSEWDEARKYLYGRDVYIDTSSTFVNLTSEMMAECIMEHRSDRVLFGTDSPLTTQSSEIMRIENLPLDASIIDKIFYYNAAELLSI